MADPGVEGEGKGERACVSVVAGNGKLELFGLLDADLTEIVCKGLGAAFR